MTKEDLIRGLNAFEVILDEQALLAKDGLIFICDKGLWNEFMDFHSEQHIQRGARSAKNE